jgi:hypothetical protein
VPRLGRILTFAVLAAVAPATAGCDSSSPHDASPESPVAATAAPEHAPTTSAPGRTAKRLSETAGRPVATIGHKRITLGALEHWASVGTYPRAGTPEGDSRAALSSLIHAQWLIDEAAEEGLKADSSKLEPESVVSRLSELIYRRLERKAPSVTPADVARYYERHKRSFTIPEQRDLHIVRTASAEAANRARREIEGGASFAAVVQKTSLEQPISARDGLLLGLGSNNWPEQPLSNDIFHARLKTLEGPVKISLGYYVFEVLRKHPAHQSTLAEAMPKIRELLHRKSRDQTVSRFILAFRRKWLARTDCRPGYVVKYCRQYKPSTKLSRESPTAL